MTTTAKHPVPYSPSIIEALRSLIPAHVPDEYGIHDPFAGEGLRLGALCDDLGRVYTGTDLEAWKDADARVALGDATDPATYPEHAHAIVTSPTYNNGVNDHFAPSAADTSRRLTYRVAAGHALHDNNTGRWSGRSSKRGEAMYWRLHEEALKCWPSIVLVNVKDSVRAGEVYPLVEMWRTMLTGFGYRIDTVDVGVDGWRYGSNAEARATEEAILIGKHVSLPHHLRHIAPCGHAWDVVG